MKREISKMSAEQASEALAELETRLHALLPRPSGDSVVESERPITVRVEALERLGTLARQAAEHRTAASATTGRAFEKAVIELVENIRALEERVCGNERPPFAYVTWAWRVYRSLSEYYEAAFTPAAPVDSTPPNTVVTAESAAAAPGGSAARPLSAAEPAPLLRQLAALLPPTSSGPAGASRVDALLDLAASETSFVQRRRRLFEAARRAVLDEQASGAASDEGLQARLLHISGQIRSLNRLQSAGLDPTIDVFQQLKWAAARRDMGALGPCVAALEQFAQTGSTPARVRRIVARLPAPVRAASPPISDHTSVTEGFPAGVLDAVRRGLVRARSAWEQRNPAPGAIAERLASHAFAKAAMPQLFAAASQVDGLCELGRSVAPVRSAEEQARLRPVSYPTQTMVFRPARTVENDRAASWVKSSARRPLPVLWCPVGAQLLASARKLRGSAQQQDVGGRPQLVDQTVRRHLQRAGVP